MEVLLLAVQEPEPDEVLLLRGRNVIKALKGGFSRADTRRSIVENAFKDSFQDARLDQKVKRA